MLRKERTESAKINRKITDENAFRFKLLSLQKWDFIKQKRAEF